MSDPIKTKAELFRLSDKDFLFLLTINGTILHQEVNGSTVLH